MIFKSSGQRGDILFSLSLLDYYPKEHHTLVLVSDESLVSWPGHQHAGKPLNDFDITNFNLLLSAIDIECIGVTEAESRGIFLDNIQVDFDKFRNVIDLFNGDLIFSNLIAQNILPIDPFKPSKTGWLNSLFNNRQIVQHNKIVINRTFRYRTNIFNYGALERFKNDCIFIGHDDEYKDFCKTYFPIDRKNVDSYIDIFDTIAGSKCFVGNQSFMFSVAESIAKLRFVEQINPRCGLYTNNGFNRIDEDLIKEFLI